MRHKIIIIMPSRPSQLRFSAESVFSELSRPTRESDSSRSAPRRIRLGRLVSDSAESLNRGYGRWLLLLGHLLGQSSLKAALLRRLPECLHAQFYYIGHGTRWYPYWAFELWNCLGDKGLVWLNKSLSKINDIGKCLMKREGQIDIYVQKQIWIQNCESSMPSSLWAIILKLQRE